MPNIDMTPSPRSSVDATQNPASPFLHNLHQRLRKGSNASRASSMSSEATQGNNDTSTPQDSRTPKQYLASVVRDDWDYPEEANEDSTAYREPINYRLRDESASEYESEPHITHGEDPYRFDNPDDVGAMVERRRARRRRLLDQEMTWNDGLRVWTLRRDAWVGAVMRRPRHAVYDIDAQQSGSKAVNDSSSSVDQHTRSPTLSKDQRSNEAKIHNGNANSSDSVHEDRNTDEKDGPYLPIYPPLFSSSHALRSRIKPSSYPALYSKVVIQSLTPNVPIPLNHMIGALVSGWKSEGNWPPQPTAETVAARRQSKKGESAFQKWKREQDMKRKAGLTDRQPEAEGSEHKGVRKSITGVVKKAFGRKDHEDDDEQDLETLGLTFEADEQEDVDLESALANGHV